MSRERSPTHRPWARCSRVEPNQTLAVTFTPSDTTDYSTISATTTINVEKAAPTVIWYNPIDIAAGTALSATQLNARALIPGSFVYSPPLGTKLDAGAGQTLTATFTPTDTTDYASTVATVTINVGQGTTSVGKLTPTLKVTDPGGRFDGAAFPATVTVAGSGNLPAASLEGVTPTLTYYNERREQPGRRGADGRGKLHRGGRLCRQHGLRSSAVGAGAV